MCVVSVMSYLLIFESESDLIFELEFELIFELEFVPRQMALGTMRTVRWVRPSAFIFGT
jgi:hypothetical protein